MQSVAQGLFSVFAVLGAVPIIKCVLQPSFASASVLRWSPTCVLCVVCVVFCRCQPDGPSRMVATLLDRMIRDHVSQGRGVFSAAPSTDRPVLILVDRSFDLTAGLTHTSTYQVRPATDGVSTRALFGAGVLT